MSESTESGAHWPGFRGANRDGIVRGSQIETDWAANPPIELWRRAVGPGWSSFAVKGDLIYTQEQRGDDEVVVCYDLTTGSQVWQHTDGTRFWEAIGGPGPRGTPTLHGSRVYSFGANGTLNALNANDGTVIWSRDVADDAGVEIPMWGFSSSPLIVDDILIIAAAGTLAAYDLETGKTRWVGTHGGGGYSSPHQATLSGVTQVVITSSSGVAGVSPTDGKQLWKYAWAGDGIVQPAFTPEGDILMGSNAQAGRISVRHTSGRWAVEEHWSSNRLKPYFNDFVVHNDHAYGFDGRHLACIDIAEGERQWKGGRYGSGQLILLADQDLLLVTSEKGELALVSATPGGFKEVARVPAIEGKTWNHPVLVGDMLLIRNGEEMAAFRLSLVAGT